MPLTNSVHESTAVSGVLGATNRVNRTEAEIRLRVRATLLNAWIEARELNGEIVVTPETIGKLDLMYKHLTNETICTEAVQ